MRLETCRMWGGGACSRLADLLLVLSWKWRRLCDLGEGVGCCVVKKNVDFESCQVARSLVVVVLSIFSKSEQRDVNRKNEIRDDSEVTINERTY